MATPLERFAYSAAQRLRVSWYSGQKWLSARLTEPVRLPAELKARMPDRARLMADLDALLEQDWRNIEAGHYRLPEELVIRPLAALRKAGRYFADLRRVDERRRGAANDEVFRAAPRGRYPRYFLQNFHYQTDGYLSRASAELYDHQVEVLFGGAAAAMRRQALVPLRDALCERGRAADSARLLDLGCGTGGFLREVKRNYPRLAVTGLDLSAPYLAVARRQLRAWSRTELIEGAAEAIPVPDASFDVVTAIYLFHELPGRVRRAVAGEIRRVLRPGGRFILVDSLQTGDAPDYDALLEYFPFAFHEPYYASYLSEDLDRLMQPDLVPTQRSLAYFSKVVAYRCGGVPPTSHNM